MHIAQFHRVSCALGDDIPCQETANRAATQQTNTDFAHFCSFQEIKINKLPHDCRAG